MSNNPIFPFREDMTVMAGTTVSQPWQIWFRNLFTTTQAQPTNLATVTQGSQSASVSTTPFQTGSLSGGLYRVNVFAHITTPGSISSSLIITISFTNDGLACSISTPALTTNTSTSVVSQSIPIEIDAGTPVSWSTTYASNSSGSMLYTVAVMLETLSLS